MTLFLLGTFYVDYGRRRARRRARLPGRSGSSPSERNAKVVEAHVTWNYTTVLNIIFLALAAVLVWRFVRTGGLPMLRMMNRPMAEEHDHGSAAARG